MGNDCTISSKINPKVNTSEQSYRCEGLREREPVVKFSEKNIFYSDPNFLLSAVSLERKARDILMRNLSVQPTNKDQEIIRKNKDQEIIRKNKDQEIIRKNKDQEIIRKISEELLVAKEAMDECLYNDLRTGNGSYSIVPFAQIEE